MREHFFPPLFVRSPPARVIPTLCTTPRFFHQSAMFRAYDETKRDGIGRIRFAQTANVIHDAIRRFLTYTRFRARANTRRTLHGTRENTRRHFGMARCERRRERTELAESLVATGATRRRARRRAFAIFHAKQNRRSTTRTRTRIGFCCTLGTDGAAKLPRVRYVTSKSRRHQVCSFLLNRPH